MKRFYGFVLLLFFCLVQVVAGNPVRILAIGNSFSEDAVEQNLHELAAAAGIRTVIGNLYIPGCPLELHVKNMKADSPAYRYRVTDAAGKQTQIDSMTLRKALESEEWNYVSVQQVSQLSGLYDSYQPYLHELVAYVKAHVPATTRIVFHQTWAYAQDSDHGGFANYGRDQMKMYRAIMEASRRAVKDERLTQVIPTGTAVQNARTSSYGDHMNRDGFHLNLLYGRYTAACTWFAALFHCKVMGNGYAPQGMTPQQVKASQLAADEAVRHPYRVTRVNY